MATQQANHVSDSSTLTNFKDWAQAISSAFTTFGWVQTADTGQVNWASIVSAPAANGYVYEIWHPADALQTGATAYYVKVEYGNQGTVASPQIRLTIGTGTNGSGTITGGFILGPYFCPRQGLTSLGASTVAECSYSGDTGRFGCLLWRNTNNVCAFSIERTLDSTGAPQSDGVTLFIGGNDQGGRVTQQTLAFGVGLGNVCNSPIMLMAYGQAPGNTNNSTTQALAGNIPMSPMFPLYGKFGNPHTVVLFGRSADVGEGTTFTTTVYGSTRTYLATSGNQANSWAVQNGNNTLFCLRYD